MSFPFRILNDMSAKLKAAEANIDEVRKYYEVKIATLIEEYEKKLGHICYEASHSQVSGQAQQTEHVKEELETENCEEEVDDEEAVDDEKAVDDEEIGHLKNKMSQLVYENNRYHLMLSNCTSTMTSFLKHRVA